MKPGAGDTGRQVGLGENQSSWLSRLLRLSRAAALYSPPDYVGQLS